MIINIIIAAIGLLFTCIIWFHYHRNGSKDLLNTLPSIWTSLGILGTFIALVLSLRGLDTSKIDIAKLVLSIAPAFETSIIGISMALLSSLVIKIHFARSEKKEEDSYLTEAGEDVSPELLLYRIYKEQKDTNSLMSSMIHGISDEVITYVSLTIDEKISSIIDGHISRMTEALNRESTLLENFSQNISSQTERISNDSQESIRGLSDAFISQIQAIKDSFESRLSTIATDITAQTDIISQGSQESVRSLSEAFSNQIQTIKDDLERILSSISTEVTTSFSESLNTISSSTNNDINNLVTTVADKNTSLVDAFNSAKEEWLKTAKASMSDTFSSLKEDLVSIITQLSSASSSLKSSLDDANTYMTNTTTGLKDVSEYTSNIQTNIQNLCEAIRSDFNSIESLASKIDTIVKTTSDVLDSNYQLQYQLRQIKKADSSQETKPKTLFLGLRKTKKCPECGTEVPVAAEFCSNCRHRFE